MQTDICLYHHIIVSIDRDTWTVSLSSAGGRSVNAAIEDIRPALCDDSFAGAFRDANDVINDEIEDT